MELQRMKCPDCGAFIEYEPGSSAAKCEYCGGSFHVAGVEPKQSEISAEQSGYEFEKGRQRAMKEQQAVNTIPVQTIPVQNYKPIKKNNHLLLWILGWMCIFPVPLTILIWRSKLDKKVKIGLTAALWIVVLILGSSNRNSSRTNYNTQSPVTEEVTTRATTERKTTESKTTEAKKTEEKTTEEQKPSRDGWNSSTNVVYTYQGYSFELPDYFEKSEETDNKIVFKGDDDKCIISLAVVDNEETFDYSRVSVNDINKFYESFDKDNNFTLIDSKVNKYSGFDNAKASLRKYKYDDGKDVFWAEVFIIFDGDKGNVVIMGLKIPYDSEFDYSDDYAKIRESIRNDGATESTESADTGNGISTDFKEVMDAYEAFIDEYVDFMNKYSENMSDLTLLSEYSDMLQKEVEWADKIDKMKESEMTDAELAYYLEVTERCNKKLLSVSGLSGGQGD